jgi:DNA gyrase subunit A
MSNEEIVEIQPIEIQEEMENSFLEYAMSVIVSRALPDARDGLKPVHRRILYGMHESNLRPDRPYSKCAQVVGHVMGKYHPHGDSAIYDALARMIQKFSLRAPLIDGHGSFGSPDPDSRPAAMRYTECRLAPISLKMLEGLDEDTVDFTQTYDGRDQEPEVLPSRLPNLLVNGSQGIAVGMATNIPPHNLGEIIDATLMLLDNPELVLNDLLEVVKGPDFPTGAYIVGTSGIRSAFATGRGSVKLRAVCDIEDNKIIVTELAYQTSVESIERKIAELVNNKELEGIRALRNESAKGKTRLVVELKRDANANVVLNNLFKRTQLQTSFGVNMLALVDGVPKQINLLKAIQVYIEHQKEVITRRTQFRLDKANARLHIVEGLLKAIDMLDEVIATIRQSQTVQIAKDKLVSKLFDFTEIQASHILDMPLRRLTGLELQKLAEEKLELMKLVTFLKEILNSQERLIAVIKEELLEVRETFTTPRRSQIVPDEEEMQDLDFIEDEEVVVMLSKEGYIKATTIESFKTQNRGGRGVIGGKLKEEDIVQHLVSTSLHAYILLFTNRGKVYRLRCHQLPLVERTSRGNAIVNFIPLQEDEYVQSIIDTRDYEEGVYLLFATKKGVVKKTSMTQYDSNLKAGLIAISLKDGDELVSVQQVSGEDNILLTTSNGKSIKFKHSEVRPMGRTAAGVRGIKLAGKDDAVIGCTVSSKEVDILFITEKGSGKRTDSQEFNLQHRGGQGVRCMKVTKDKGKLVAAESVREGDEVLSFTSAGSIVRVTSEDISKQGRNASGVKVVRIDDGEKVVAVTKVIDRES